MDRIAEPLGRIDFRTTLAALLAGDAGAALTGNGADKIVDSPKKYVLVQFNACTSSAILHPNGSFSPCSDGADSD